MKKILLISLGIVGLLAVIFGITTAVEYNVLVGQHEEIKFQKSQVINSLETRDSTIEGLAAAVDTAIGLETDVYEMITGARVAYAEASDSGDLEAIIEADVLSSLALSELYAVIEDNPELQSIDTIETFMANIESLENALKVARGDYNAAVRDYNVSVRKFPRIMFANMFGFESQMPYWTPDPETGDGTITVSGVDYSSAVYVA
ncbi:MAG: LemA family protein [Bacteroidia bacterium]|nr:LemA family protein [Bacteroidia bacterium]